MPDSNAIPPTLPVDWPHVTCSFFLTTGTIRWHVQRAGAGPTIVLVHGSAGATHTWRAVFPLLTRVADVIAFDLPGHGFTTGATTEQLSLEGMTTAVADLLRALDVRPSIGVGHSAGAAVLLQLAASSNEVSPHSIIGVNSALVSINALGEFLLPVSRAVFDVPLIHAGIATLLRTTSFAHQLLQSTGTTLEAEQEARYVSLLTDETRVGAVLRMMSRWNLSALQEAFPRLQRPVTLVHSRNEPWVSFDALLEATRTLPQRTVIDVTPAGHLIPDEKPVALADIILAALAIRSSPPG